MKYEYPVCRKLICNYIKHFDSILLHAFHSRYLQSLTNYSASPMLAQDPEQLCRREVSLVCESSSNSSHERAIVARRKDHQLKLLYPCIFFSFAYLDYLMQSFLCASLRCIFDIYISLLNICMSLSTPQLLVAYTILYLRNASHRNCKKFLDQERFYLVTNKNIRA